MDNHAVLPPEYQAGGESKSEDLCQQVSERGNKTTPGASSSRQLDTPGASRSGWPTATEDLSSGKKVYLRPNTDGEMHMKMFDDPANNVKAQSEEEHEFNNQILKKKSVPISVRFLPIFKFLAQRSDLEPIYERRLMVFNLAYRASRRRQKDVDE